MILPAAAMRPFGQRCEAERILVRLLEAADCFATASIDADALRLAMLTACDHITDLC
jgi:hypothetical protein